MTISNPLSGLNSIVVSASVSNMNGFIIIAIMNGLFDATTMTLPTTNNIKKGLFEENQPPLLAVRMQYAPQNFNISLSVDSLISNSNYTIFYYATMDDPTLTSSASSVGYNIFKTLEVLDISINWGFRNGIGLGLLLLAFLMLH